MESTVDNSGSMMAARRDASNSASAADIDPTSLSSLAAAAAAALATEDAMVDMDEG